MRTLWAGRTVEAPASVVWDLLTDPDRWADWGPSVRSAELDGSSALGPGVRGTVTTAVGVRVPFEITDWVDGRSWSWRVAGVPATDHLVDPLGPGRCRVAFGVPFVAAPYLAVCRLALTRVDALATDD